MLSLVFALLAAVEVDALLPVLRTETLQARGVAHGAPRARAVVSQEEEPFRQDEQYSYFRRTKKMEDVTLSKPLGTVLVGREGATVVDGFQEGSEAAQQALKKGDRIQTINGVDATQMAFDDVMAMIVDAPEELTLGIARPVIVKKARADLQPSAPAAPEQEPSKLDKAFAKNFGSAEATKKILTKTAKITANPTTWKNPIYFWSIAGTAVLFVPLILYSLSK
jgi:hypothetical protein